MTVNGKIRQQDMAQNMHFKIDEIISYISTYIKLDDGDLILTGTPDGVGPVVSGDKVAAYGKVKG
jgi:2-keto-4-pentenoate hydratase/2-oxohepta-3-ene-1,7-dioic acid hydratase in catechol pathway